MLRPARPLNARVIETIDTPDWKREKILYMVAGKSVPAYLYLPKGFHRPLQVIHFAQCRLDGLMDGHCRSEYAIDLVHKTRRLRAE